MKILLDKINYSDRDLIRKKTRRSRYLDKSSDAITLPVYLVAFNFDMDDNIAFLIRTAACFGAKELFVIGSAPNRSSVNSKSGSLFDFVKIRQFSNPSLFLSYCRDNDISIVSLEISDSSSSIYNHMFDFNKDTAVVLGHETIGIPSEIFFNSGSVLSVPMPGVGYCLNTSQAGTAVMTEYSRQFFERGMV